MLNARGWLFVALGAFTVFLVWVWFRSKNRAPGIPSLFELFVGMATNFFDTLGIGSFAPSASIFKFWHMVPDEKIPGTLNVGHALPTLLEAFLFIAIVKVDILTLVLLMAASVCGAWFGAGIVASWPRRWVQIGMGIALLAAASFFLMTNLNLLPAGGNALILQHWRLWAGVVGSLFLGALMTLGIGLYGPCMILVSVLGMDPHAAFPIMMGSCAFLMPVASARFIQAGSYSPRVSLGLALGGLPGVLIAALIVKSLSLTAVRWLVVVAVIYAAFTMLRSAMQRSAVEVPQRNRIPGLVVGLVAGAIIGFLFRPAVPIFGQLPLETVITRGANLSGLDVALKGAAEQSFNYMLGGAIACGFLGVVTGGFLRSREGS